MIERVPQMMKKHRSGMRWALLVATRSIVDQCQGTRLYSGTPPSPNGEKQGNPGPHRIRLQPRVPRISTGAAADGKAVQYNLHPLMAILNAGYRMGGGGGGHCSFHCPPSEQDESFVCKTCSRCRSVSSVRLRRNHKRGNSLTSLH